MRAFRYYLRLTFAFINRFKGLILLSTIAGIVIFVLSSIIIPKILQNKKETIGITGRYQINTLPDFITTLIGAGLTKVDESGIAQPDLASSWETPDKGKTWIFHLKDNIFWHDNKPLISSDLTYNFNDVEVNYPDDSTIVFNLDAAYIPFPVIVSRPVFKKGLLGTGDWRADRISLVGDNVQKIVLKKGREKKIFIFYPTEEQQKFAYKLGEISEIINLSNSSPFDQWPNSKIIEHVNENQSVVIFFNTQDSVLSEKNIRQALNYAIDKDKLGTSRSISPLAPSSFAFNPQVKAYNYDPQKAKQIIDDLSSEARQNLKIKLVSSPTLLRVAEKIADYWRYIGVDTQVLVTSIIPSDYQAYLTIFDIPADPDQYSLWHSTESETNITNYTNPRIDKLLEDGRIEMDIEERKETYLDFQRFLVEDSPAIFLYHPIWYDIARK
jgi:peptide/nickel transport system substrate-binding protein